MKYILTGLLLVCYFGASAQTYSTKTVSIYQKVFSEKYSYIETDVNASCYWEFTDTQMYRSCGLSSGDGGKMSITKLVNLTKGKKYIVDSREMDDGWFVVDDTFIIMYEDNGATMRKFKISKKSKQLEYLN